MRTDETQTDGYGHVLKYTGIFGGVQGLNILVGLVRNKLVALLLGPSGMGLASLYNTTINFISQSTTLGISISAVRHVSELFDSGDEERILHFVKVVRAWSMLTGLLGALVCMLAGPLIANYAFSWDTHILSFIMLAPAVACMAIIGGETAILKGARQLKALALIQLVCVFAALVISVPVYYFYGTAGIVPVIVITTLANLLATVHYSYKLYPLRMTGNRGILGEGMGMVRLGMAFVMAGIMGSGAEMLIRSYINLQGNLPDVGLYNAGYILIFTYGSVFFSAMESDYFPRLSAVGNDNTAMREMVNRQIEVSILLAAPLMWILLLGLPLLVEILFSSKFLPVVGMAQVAVFSIFLRCISLPVSYQTLARGKSMAYMLLECIYDVLFVTMVIVGYTYWGLLGAGVALSLSYVIEIVIVVGYTGKSFGYRPTWPVLFYAGVHLLLGIGVYMATLLDNCWIHWLAGTSFCLLSLGFSLLILSKKTSLWNKLKKNLLHRNYGA